MKTDETDWPIPDYTNRKKPDIPSEFRLFGINFTVKDGIPYTGEEFEDLDLTKIKNMTSKSLSEFKKLLKTDGPEHFENIKQLHTKINDMINSAKLWEANILINNMENEKTKYKKSLNEKINRLYKQ